MTLKLADRVRQMAPSPTLMIDTRTKELIAAGHNVLNFSVGEPDFDTPEHIKEAARRAMAEGHTKYTPAAGTIELRQAICDKLKADNGLAYEPADIVVSNGGKQSLYNIYQAILDPGDEVVIQAPYWVSYPEIVKLAGGVPVIVDSTSASGFRLTAAEIEAALTPRTRAINLNSPSNPTGAVYSRRELEAIAELAVRHGLYIVTDEIYEKLMYGDTEHVSIASLGPDVKRLTVTVNGFSKAYAMTGWRMGYCAAERPLAKAMADLQGQSTSGPSSITQKAAVAALRGPQEPVEQMRVEFERRRNYIVERLNRLPGVDCLMPDGAFYVFPSVAGLLGREIAGRHVATDVDLCTVLLEETGVSFVPGSAFGAPGHVRISYATSMENIVDGLDRVEAVLGGK